MSTVDLSSPSNLAADLELALQLANLADSITLRRFQALDLRVEAKADMSLVSDADQDCERAIRGELTEKRPSDGILGEEDGLTQAEAPRQWVIDPIDGTHNYVRGVPVWATLIGLIEDGVPVLGVVSAPALGRRWWAVQGGGAYGTASHDGGKVHQLHVSQVGSLSDAFLSYSSLDGWEKIGRSKEFDQLMGASWRTRGFGDFWNYMLVAEGAVDIAAEPELALHDMAAIAPIVTEAGGKFTNIDGLDGPWGPGAVATNGLLHDQVLEVLSPKV